MQEALRSPVDARLGCALRLLNPVPKASEGADAYQGWDTWMHADMSERLLIFGVLF